MLSLLDSRSGRGSRIPPGEGFLCSDRAERGGRQEIVRDSEGRTEGTFVVRHGGECPSVVIDLSHGKTKIQV